MTRSNFKKQEKRTYHFVNFTSLAIHTVKLEESKKINKYLNLARELNPLPPKKKQSKKTTTEHEKGGDNCSYVPRTVPNTCQNILVELEMKGSIETTGHSIVNLARIPRRVLETK